MIRFENVSKSYGPLMAVRDLTLEVHPGELFGFLGPNGAGKTTTIKMATGMLKPTTGRIVVAGHDVYADGTSARSLIGYVPDTPYLYDKLTGHEFLEFIADLYSISAAQSRARIAELLQLFELNDSGDQLIEGYSRGMKQKLLIASVLVHNPRVVFLDEPTTSLDPKSARLVKALLRQLCTQGATVFISSWYPAETVCSIQAPDAATHPISSATAASPASSFVLMVNRIGSVLCAGPCQHSGRWLGLSGVPRRR